MADRPNDPSRQPSPAPDRTAPDGPAAERPGELEEPQTVGWFQLAGLGLEFIAGVLVLGWFGWWLDGRWKTTPWLMIAGGAIGFAVGLVTLIRTALRAFKD